MPERAPRDGRLFCLTPVRNGHDHFDRYFACVDALGASVIALDDGSTDDTLARLRSEPSVVAVLANPRRPDYRGWDDAENRKRLLAACDDVAPGWILWLDVDEVVAASDVPLLRRFLATDARAGRAYGLEVLRMIGDDRHFDRCKLWVYRLFAWRAGFTLPEARLHFEPVPHEIAAADRIRTRLRILHYSSHSSAARAERHRKYQEADPDCDWQEGYDDLLDEPGHVWPLRPLPPGQSLIIG